VGKKILLADDSITIQKVIELTFSDEDFEVVTVGNGRLAMERLPDARPDLVLCDIIMPEKDGYEVCDFIKKTPSLAHIPVLLLTGAFEPFDQERAARVGCDGYLAKPFEPQTLIAKVKDLLSKAASKPAAAAPSAPAPAAAAPPAPAAAPAPPAAIPAPPTPATPATPAFVPPAYDRGTGFDAAPAAGTPPAPAAPWGAAGREPEPEPESEPELEAEAEADAEPDLATVKSAPYAADAERFMSKVPTSLDELYDEDAYGAPDDLMPLTDDESASVSGPAEEPPVDDEPAPWAQPTVEVPLETRAQAGVESAQMASEPGFEEVFDESAPPLRSSVAAPAPAPPTVERGFGFVRQEDVLNSPAAPSVPSPASPPTVKEGFGWVRDADVPGAAAPPAVAAPAPPPEASFRDLAPAPEPPAPEAAKSVTGEVPVPVDMVEKIAQRVVAQISEKVIREIAWEVIPDLAEALIKREIDRLKAELQQT
jgi:CheY-like chemotaxis protein